MSDDWFAGLPDATARIHCGSETHVVRWHAGRLETPAHPDIDLEAERALAALAGESCRCAELLDTWERHSADPRVLVLGPRAQDSRLALEHQQMARARRRPAPSLAGAGVTAEERIQAVLDLDGALPHRFVATAAAELADRTEDPALAATLQAALYGRVLASLHRWTGRTPELELVMAAGEPSLARDLDENFSARLPYSWFTEVWARRLDVVDGQFTLGTRRGASGKLELISVNFGMTRLIRTLAPL